MASYPIHVAMYYWPHPLPDSIPEMIEGHSVSTIQFSGESFTERFPVSFENALAAMESEFGAHTEGDGSFGFSGLRENGAHWRVSGSVFEAETNVACLDVWLEGCRSETVKKLLETLNAAEDEAVVQLLESNRLVSVPEFCRWIEVDG